MPSRATGSALTKTKAGVYVARPTLQGKRYSLQLPQCQTEALAQERSDQLAELAQRMTLAQTDHADALDGLQRVASAPAGQTLRVACALVDKLIGGWRPKSTKPTFAQVAALWNADDQKLAREYPDDIDERCESTIGIAKATLARDIFPRIGELPVDYVTLEHCNEIKRSLGHVRTDTRRKYLTPLKSVLDICVVLGHIERSPLPDRWLPSEQGPRVLQWLRPREDLQLMQCRAIPLCWRVLWGFYARNGARKSEALAMTISQFDLGEQPIATLYESQTKTRKLRSWPLDPGDAEGLRMWRMLARPDAQPSEPMFVGTDGAAIRDNDQLPDMLREHLLLADINRPELYVTTETSRRICPHDLRASFVTTKLALGWSTDDIELYTGHESVAQMKVYKRVARTLKEAAARAKQRPADFTPLVEAIPELAEASEAERQRCVSDVPNLAGILASRYSVPDLRTGPQPDESIEKRVDTRSGSAVNPGSRPAADASMTLSVAVDAVEAALADALARASVAGEWSVVAQLAHELEARRLARAAVVDIAAERKRRSR